MRLGRKLTAAFSDLFVVWLIVLMACLLVVVVVVTGAVVVDVVSHGVSAR